MVGVYPNSDIRPLFIIKVWISLFIIKNIFEKAVRNDQSPTIKTAECNASTGYLHQKVRAKSA